MTMVLPAFMLLKSLCVRAYPGEQSEPGDVLVTRGLAGQCAGHSRISPGNAG